MDTGMADMRPTHAFLSLKGGVGKSSLTLGVASSVAAHGGRVLIVDMDQNKTTTSQMTRDPLPPTAAGVLEVLAAGDPRATRSAIRVSRWSRLSVIARAGGAVHYIPGDTRSSEVAFAQYPLGSLAVALQGVRNDYDLILIDGPPRIDLVTKHALAAAFSFSVVTEASHVSIAPTFEFTDQMLPEYQEMVTAAGFRMPLFSGVVCNRFNRSLQEHHAALAELRDLYGTLLLQPPIPERTMVQRAQGYHKPLDLYRNPSALEMRAVFARLAGRTLRSFQQVSLGPLTLRLGGEPLVPAPDDMLDVVYPDEDGFDEEQLAELAAGPASSSQEETA